MINWKLMTANVWLFKYRVSNGKFLLFVFFATALSTHHLCSSPPNTPHLLAAVLCRDVVLWWTKCTEKIRGEKKKTQATRHSHHPQETMKSYGVLQPIVKINVETPSYFKKLSRERFRVLLLWLKTSTSCTLIGCGAPRRSSYGPSGMFLFFMVPVWNVGSRDDWFCVLFIVRV